MKYQIELKSDIVQRAFEKVLSFDTRSRGDFFYDIRRSFKEEIEDLLVKEGIQVNKESFLGNTTNLRSGKVIEVNPIKTKYNQQIDVEFCSGYGHDDYSLSAINYIDENYCELPSLFPFFKVKEFSIGNMAILVANGNYDIEINTQDSIKIVGYSYHISSRKKKSYLCLFGIRFKYSLLQPIFKRYYKNCNCKDSDLDEIRMGVVRYPIIFICRKCGQLFTCKCFENHFDIEDDIIRSLPSDRSVNNEVREHVKKIRIREKICHLCTGNTPKMRYGHEMYYSLFLQIYLPYYRLFSRKKESEDNQSATHQLSAKFERHREEVNKLIELFIRNGEERQLINRSILPPIRNIANPWLAKSIHDDYLQTLRNIIIEELANGESRVDPKYRGIVERYYNVRKELSEHIKALDRATENELRKKLNYPLIGEGWISETTLFKIVQTLFSTKNIIHHYRGKELEGLEIDIWIPDLKLAVEYQGEQHFHVVEHWGGKEGLNKRIESDRKKKIICKKVGYNLIEFKYDEELTVENVEKKLIKYLDE